MWMQKLTSGVLRVLTPLGPRYIQPSLRQRIYLLWIFRHFPTLSPKVLTSRQQNLMDSLCAAQQFVSLNVFDDAPVIGTLEGRPASESVGGESETGVREPVSRFAADRPRA
jgi:hypothetical protein